MEVPLVVVPRNIQLSDAAMALIRERAERLEHFFRPIIRCQVYVEGPGPRHRAGGPYEVRIDLRLPGEEIAIDRQTTSELAAAVREAFDAARRRLEDYVRRQRHEVKTHAAPPVGHVKRLFRGEGYGFLETADGREIYFHRNSVLEPGFGRLQVGDAVRFSEERGDAGPQASTLIVADGAS
jgi:cold shock CspA family protein